MRNGYAGVNRLLGGCIHTTGGNFKPDKCHVSVHAQVLDGKGGYEYLSSAQRAARAAVGIEDDLKREGVQFTVPQADSTAATI